MEESHLLREKALNFVLSINEANKLLKNFSRSESNKLKEILNKLCEISLFRISLPDKLIDTILCLLIKILETLKNQKLLKNDYLNSINKLITLDSIIINFSSINDYIAKKWIFFKQIFIFYLNIIYSKENNDEISINDDIINDAFYLINYVFFNISSLCRYEILPGVFSKIINFISKQDQIYLKHIKTCLMIIYEYISIIGILVENVDFDKNEKRFQVNNAQSMDILIYIEKNENYNNLLINLLNSLEYFFNYIVFTFDSVNNDTNCILISKVSSLSNEFVMIFNKFFSVNSQKLEQLFDVNSFNNINQLNILTLREFIIVSIRLMNKLSFANSNNSSSIKDIVFYSRKEREKTKLIDIIKIKDYILEIFSSVKLLFNRNEIHKFNKYSIDLTGFSLILFNSYTLEYLNNDTNGKELDDNTNYLNKYYNEIRFLLRECYQINKTFILEILNNYEIDNRIITKEECREKLDKLIFSVLKYESEINYSICNQLLINFPLILRSKLIEDLITTIVSSIKLIKIGSDIENETQFICQDLFILYFLLKTNSDPISNLRIVNNLKLITTSLISIIDECLVDFKNKNQNRNSVFLSIICLISSQVLNFFNKFRKQELKNLLNFSLFSFSTNIMIQKFSAYILLYTLSDIENASSIQNYISSNFDLILGLTFNKLIFLKTYSNPLLSDSNVKSMNFSKIIILNLFNSLLIFIEKLTHSEILIYCGTLNNFIKKLFYNFDTFYSEKEYEFIYYYLEIFLKITKFISKYILILNEKYTNTNPIEGEFNDFIKNKMQIDDLNIMRHLTLRIRPLIISKNIKISYVCLTILYTLIPVLNLLPLSREEAINFSTEDPANVQIRNSLGPIFFEIYPYLIYNLKSNKLKTIELIISIFISVSKIYSKDFFNESRIFDEFLPTFEKTILEISKKFNFSQIKTIFVNFFEFFQSLNWKKLIKIKNLKYLYNLLQNQFDIKLDSINNLDIFSLELMKNIINEISNLIDFIRGKERINLELDNYCNSLNEIFLNSSNDLVRGFMKIYQDSIIHK